MEEPYAKQTVPGRGRLRLCRIATVPITFASLLRRQIDSILQAGIDLTLVSSPGPELEELSRLLPVRCFTIPMVRTTSPWQDLKAVMALTQLLRRESFDIVHSSTPKAGLISALAARAARTPIRIHTYTGQVWVELHGALRWVTRESDKWVSRLCTHTYADSLSQRDFLVQEGIVRAAKISVLGHGSISGVDLERFDSSLFPQPRAEARKRLGIAEDSVVIIFVGRVTRDKGITELTAAFRAVQSEFKNLDLILAGPYESIREPLPEEAARELSTNSRIHAVGFTSRPEEYLAVADIFCMPSYREGFGSVVIEAGAMNLPCVATRVTGLVDSVVDGETGILVPAKDSAALAAAIKKLILSPDLRRRMGAAARRRVVLRFDAKVVNRAVVDEYIRLAQTI